MRRRSFLRSTAQVTLLGGVGAAGSSLGRRDAGVGAAAGGGQSTETPARTADAGFAPLADRRVDGIREVVTTEDGRTAFAAVGDGFASFDLTDPAAPEPLARVDPALADHEMGPMENVWDVKYDDGRLLVGGPGSQGSTFFGLALYDVGDPADPRLLGAHDTGTVIHNCDVAGEFAYHVDEHLGIVDVGGDEFETVATWSLPDHDDAWTEVPSYLLNPHDVWAEGDRAYVSYWDAGCVILDVSDPADPSVVGRAGERSLADLRTTTNDRFITLPGNAHYAEPGPDGDLLAVGKEAGPPRMAAGGIDLWDISDETDPTRLVTIEPPGVTTNADGTRLWTTAHNFHLLDETLYTSWYAGGVRVFDVSDPAEPLEYAHWQDPERAYFWTARLAVPGEFFVAGSYETENIDGREDRLFTFPDPRDRDPESVRISTPSPTPTEAPTDSPTPTDPTETPSDSGTSPTREATPTGPVGTTTPGAAPTPAGTPTDGSADATGASGPGFGPLAALGALSLGAWRVARDDGE